MCVGVRVCACVDWEREGEARGCEIVCMCVCGCCRGCVCVRVWGCSGGGRIK